MAKIEFDYNPWDPKTDVMLDRPGSPLGWGMVQSGTRVSPTLRHNKRRPGGSHQAVADVVGLLAGCLEWLREHGMTATELQQAVNSYKINNRDTAVQKVRQTNERNRTLSDAQAPKERLDLAKEWHRHFVN